MLVLAASHDDCADSAICASMVFDAFGASRREERESSHYAEGRYFRAETEIKVSMGDSDYDDLPLWVIVSDSEDGQADRLKGAGFRVARLEAFGTVAEVRVDL
ncbi:hypothetical protein P1X14_02130 [Sphingomonas sp. AOB5]|uniref:hypothetical protein n=1 Tax=Sphingomonas sp. AOB5 TaxID=3034017 RepID=UPI0023FA4691|nr:hypothetical protein [Sphingomonas sp. AOB5]MDF7774032.1 hypothetical protein [Sphingomonas sp. AOB5]